MKGLEASSDLLGAVALAREAIDRPTDGAGLSRIAPGQAGKTEVLAAGGRATLVNLQSNDQSAHAYSVHFGYDPQGTYPDPVPTNYDVALVGTVQWGTGGAQHEVEFDFGRGGVLVVPASYVRVGVYYPEVARSTQPLQRVYASIGRAAIGTQGIVGAVHRTHDTGALNAGASSAWREIPRYATAVMVLADGAPTVVTSLLVYSNAPNGVLRTAFANAQQTAIPNGFQFYRVQNTSAGPAAFQVIWILSL